MAAPNSKHTKTTTRPHVFRLIVLTALFIGGGVGVVFVYAASKSSNIISANFDSRNYYKIGQTVNKQGLAFSLNSVQTYVPASTQVRPTTNSSFLAIDVTIANNSTDQVLIQPNNQIYIKDEFGKTYHPITLPLATPLSESELPAGESIRGQLGFDIPDTSNDLKLYFSPNWHNITTSIYSINR